MTRYILSRDGTAQIAATMTDGLDRLVYGSLCCSSRPYEGVEIVSCDDPEAWVRSAKKQPAPAHVDRPYYDYGFGSGEPGGMRYPLGGGRWTSDRAEYEAAIAAPVLECAA